MKLSPNVGSDRSWVWNAAADVSEGEPEAQTLAIRFGNAESKSNAQQTHSRFQRSPFDRRKPLQRGFHQGSAGEREDLWRLRVRSRFAEINTKSSLLAYHTVPRALVTRSYRMGVQVVTEAGRRPLPTTTYESKYLPPPPPPPQHSILGVPYSTSITILSIAQYPTERHCRSESAGRPSRRLLGEAVI